ncbi:MAG: glycoside hydrolase family 16 protein [Promethearchaeia archaeon]
MIKKSKYRVYFFLFVLIFPSLIFTQPRNSNTLSEGSEDPQIRATSGENEFSFSGYNWTKRTSAGEKQGPGPNYFNSSEENVWLDEDGYLHLKITKNNGKWYCAEIYSDESFGHGTYNFKLAPGFKDLDKNVILGLFTYLDDENEIDIEFAKWGDKNAKLGQFVVQPSSNLGNIHRFEFPNKTEDSVHGFTWCEEYIKFYSAIDSTFNYDEQNVVEEWFYTGNNNPEPSTEKARMNLWLMDGMAPSDGEETEVVIKGFEYEPSKCDDPVPLPPWIIWAIIIGIVCIAAVGIFFYRGRKK